VFDRMIGYVQMALISTVQEDDNKEISPERLNLRLEYELLFGFADTIV
jgi:hypothetical protein